MIVKGLCVYNQCDHRPNLGGFMITAISNICHWVLSIHLLLLASIVETKVKTVIFFIIFHIHKKMNRTLNTVFWLECQRILLISAIELHSLRWRQMVSHCSVLLEAGTKMNPILYFLNQRPVLMICPLLLSTAHQMKSGKCCDVFNVQLKSWSDFLFLVHQ